MRGKEWTEAEDKLLRSTYGSMPAKWLVENHFGDRTDIALHKRAAKIGVKADRLKMTSMAKKQYSLNERFFSTPNEINSYWAGFIAADGSVQRSNQSLKVELANKDFSHLIKFKNAIEFSGHVYERDTSSIVMYGISDTLDDLEKRFSITQCKSMTLKPPSIDDERFVRAYIRGYIDGDGSISRVSAGNTYRLSIASGSLDITEWIKCNLAQFAFVNETGIYDQANTHLLVYGGSRQSLSVLSWLYSESTRDTRLDRKYDLYQLLKSRCKNIDDSMSSKYRGVSIDRSRNKWSSCIEYGGKKFHIGRYDSEQDAARAYNAKAVELGVPERCYVV